MRRGLVLLGIALLSAGCGAAATKPAKLRRAGNSAGIPASLRAGERPIGRGLRFQPPVSGSVGGDCSPTLGRRSQAHVEVFGANQVVLLAAGIGTRGPRRFLDGRLTHARCFGSVVTLDATGVVYFRPGATLGDVFRAWGQPLMARRVASFTGGHAFIYVGGRVWRGVPAGLRLRRHDEIVVEIGPHVPPHRRFLFPPAPAADMG